MSEYTIYLCPPKYPAGLFPSSCTHEPQFVMSAAVKCGAGRKKMEIEHQVCLACGLPRPATFGGNVFIDLHKLGEKLGWHVEIGPRLIHIRGKWAKIATYLFDGDGWNGRHERVARIIDPNLTMRLVVTDTRHGRFGQVYADASYMRGAAS